MNRQSAIFSSLVIILFLGACGHPEDTELQSLQGIYRIIEFRTGEGSCSDIDAASVDRPLTEHLIVIEQTIANARVHRAVLCGDYTQCEEMRAALQEGQNIPNTEINVLFTSRQRNTASGVEQSSGFTTSEGVCSAPERVDNELRVDTQGTLSLIRRTTLGLDYPETEDGFCTTQAGARAVSGRPCSGVTILRGQRVP